MGLVAKEKNLCVMISGNRRIQFSGERTIFAGRRQRGVGASHLNRGDRRNGEITVGIGTGGNANRQVQEENHGSVSGERQAQEHISACSRPRHRRDGEGHTQHRGKDISRARSSGIVVKRGNHCRGSGTVERNECDREIEINKDDWRAQEHPKRSSPEPLDTLHKKK